jgi:hypothetical protein
VLRAGAWRGAGCQGGLRLAVDLVAPVRGRIGPGRQRQADCLCAALHLRDHAGKDRRHGPSRIVDDVGHREPGIGKHQLWERLSGGRTRGVQAGSDIGFEREGPRSRRGNLRKERRSRRVAGADAVEDVPLFPQRREQAGNCADPLQEIGRTTGGCMAVEIADARVRIVRGLAVAPVHRHLYRRRGSKRCGRTDEGRTREEQGGGNARAFPHLL